MWEHARLDELFDCLADQHRRAIIRELATTSSPMTIPELADAVADRTGGQGAGSGPDVDRIQTTLVHVHVPKLVSTGVLDDEGDGVALTRYGERTLPFLRTASERE